MKSARERAEEVIAYVFAHERESARVVTTAVEAMFKEHARDQRHLCAEAVQEATASNAQPFVRDFAPAVHHAAMNAPAPPRRSPDEKERAVVESFVRMWPNSQGKVDGSHGGVTSQASGEDSVSTPVAWLVENFVGSRWTVFTEKTAGIARERGHRVTPLVAAPPEGAPTYAELAKMVLDGYQHSDKCFQWESSDECICGLSDVLSRLPKDTA